MTRDHSSFTKATALLALVLSICASSASAGNILNGIAINGIAVNGLAINGLSINGTRLANGLTVNGMRMANGTRSGDATPAVVRAVTLADGTLLNVAPAR